MCDQCSDCLMEEECVQSVWAPHGGVSLPDYWGSEGRRESQGSLSSSTSLDIATSCSANKTEVRFL